MMSSIMDIKVKKLKDTATLPTKGSYESAGWDLYAAGTYEIPPHQTVKVGTGLAIEIDPLFWVGIFARSGLATKQGLRPANCVGVVDSDYRGEIIVALYNDSSEYRTVQEGDRIAQMILMPTYLTKIVEVDELNDTARGVGGFGSTGK